MPWGQGQGQGGAEEYCKATQVYTPQPRTQGGMGGATEHLSTQALVSHPNLCSENPGSWEEQLPPELGQAS